MDLRMKQFGIAFLAAAALAVPASAGVDQPAPLAGPSYTPKELKALEAFSAMTFAEKQAYLAGLSPARTAQAGPTSPLAGPSYTPEERKALAAYSKASFAEKQAILAGNDSVAPGSEQSSFHWRDATIWRRRHADVRDAPGCAERGRMGHGAAGPRTCFTSTVTS